MITREQVLKLRHGDIIIQIYKANGTTRMTPGGLIFIPDNTITLLPRPARWRVTGKVKIWKTRQDDFKIPIKHGLFESTYLTHDNARLFKIGVNYV